MENPFKIDEFIDYLNRYSFDFDNVYLCISPVGKDKLIRIYYNNLISAGDYETVNEDIPILSSVIKLYKIDRTKHDVTIFDFTSTDLIKYTGLQTIKYINEVLDDYLMNIRLHNHHILYILEDKISDGFTNELTIYNCKTKKIKKITV